jgi:hypothetical protein
VVEPQPRSPCDSETAAGAGAGARADDRAERAGELSARELIGRASVSLKAEKTIRWQQCVSQPQAASQTDRQIDGHRQTDKPMNKMDKS